MLEHKEAHTEKHQTFIPNRYLKLLSQIFDEFILNLHDFQDPHHLCDSEDLVQLTNSDKARHTIE